MKADIKPGTYFIVGGQKAYVAEMGEVFSNAQGRTDARLRVIFDNGQRAIALESLATVACDLSGICDEALYQEGRVLGCTCFG